MPYLGLTDRPSSLAAPPEFITKKCGGCFRKSEPFFPARIMTRIEGFGGSMIAATFAETVLSSRGVTSRATIRNSAGSSRSTGFLTTPPCSSTTTRLQSASRYTSLSPENACPNDETSSLTSVLTHDWSCFIIATSSSLSADSIVASLASLPSSACTRTRWSTTSVLDLSCESSVNGGDKSADAY